MMATDSLIDVLIIGAGPAGLMAATWFSRLNIPFRIIDKRSTKIFTGQADGLQCRTLEMLDSFGIATRLWEESNHMIEICLWNPDAHGVIRRSERIPDTIPGISRFQQVTLHQGRIERFFLDSLKEHGGREVERGVVPLKLSFDERVAEDQNAFPMEVVLQHLSQEEAEQTQNKTPGEASSDGMFRSNLAPDDTAELLSDATANGRAGERETIRPRYVIGCDGAHSWTRQQLGFSLEGEQTDYIWGVIDIIPITDFPDIRMRCAIHSANSGSVMIIPRENKLVRLYIQMTTVEKGGEPVDRTTITPAMILKCAQNIMAPYTLNYSYCDWWTAYRIGQRVCPSFSKCNRIFLAGDAVHTHSPKAGQGMNISMQDTYNLCWKIAAVVQGTSKQEILQTYEDERHKIAQELIAFDHKFSRLFSGRPAKDVMDETGISMAEFKDVFEKGNLFASGVAAEYGPSILVANSVYCDEHLATNTKLGQRIPSFKVLNQASARPRHLHELLPSNGKWRLLIFPGDVSQAPHMQRLHELAGALSLPRSCLRRFSPVIELLTIHSAPRVTVELADFPEACYRDMKGEEEEEEEGEIDYERVFVDDVSYHEGHGRAYEGMGIGGEGCVVVVRPDQHVAWVGALGGIKNVEEFFSGFMLSGE